jgi:SAM-dependent methyltransferase
MSGIQTVSNPDGVELGPDFRFPFADGSFDIVYLWGIFTNTGERDATCYLQEFARLLRPTGTLFFTAFMEDSAPDVTINPAGNFASGGCRATASAMAATSC